MVAKEVAIIEHMEGLMIAAAADDKRQLVLDVKANILQTIKSSIFRSERLFAAAQVQVNYQIYDAIAANAEGDYTMRANELYQRTSKPMLVELENSSFCGTISPPKPTTYN